MQITCPGSISSRSTPGLSRLKAAGVVLSLLAMDDTVSPRLTVYGLEPWGHSPGGSDAAVGTQITCPIWRLFGSTPGLSRLKAFTVVLNL